MPWDDSDSSTECVPNCSAASADRLRTHPVAQQSDADASDRVQIGGWGDSSDDGQDGQDKKQQQQDVRAGWGDSSEDGGKQAEQTHELPPESGRSAATRKGQKGRKKGSYGDKQVRLHLRAKREQALAEAARLALQRKREVTSKGRETAASAEDQDQSQVMSIPDLESPCLASLVNCGSTTQRGLVRTLLDVRKRHGSPEPDELLSFFLRCQSLTTSAAAVAGFFGSTQAQVGRLLLTTACCILQSAAWLWGFALSLLARKCDGEDSVWVPVLFLVKTCYDETPSKVRVVSTSEQTWLAPNSKRSPKDYLAEIDRRRYEQLVGVTETGNHAKVLQTQYSVGVLLRHRKSGMFAWFRGSVPTTLQIMDRTTAENTRAAVFDTIMDSRLHFGIAPNSDFFAMPTE